MEHRWVISRQLTQLPLQSIILLLVIYIDIFEEGNQEN